MNFTRLKQYTPLLLVLLALYPCFLYFSDRVHDTDSVNLALRRTADHLLRENGDSVSRIPAIIHSMERQWMIRIDPSCSYEKLPEILQSSLDQYFIKTKYSVTVRRCSDDFIDLGYQQADLSDTMPVPCSGRQAPEGCHYVEVTFEDQSSAAGMWATGLLLAAALTVWALRRRRVPGHTHARETVWTELGNSRLDIAGQTLFCGGKHTSLTFRETKLLRLFAENPDKLLERTYIISQVWADEGVHVGRSPDVFISRLRKKLAGDPSINIVAVHGVGYKLTVNTR